MNRDNKILNAINRGVKLALDDYEEDNNMILTKNDIIKDDGIMSFIVQNFVDLGLPSGTLWAKCNLGAKTPEEFGNYYAWGETEPKTEQCVYDTYKFINNSGDVGSTRTTKYNNIDNLTTLLPEDDAAYQFDNRMKMPTRKQFEELLKYTTHTWIMETDKLIKGMLFIGGNGNEMFIPAAGYIHEKRGLDGIEANIWSSNRYVKDEYDRASIYLYISEKHPGEIAEYDKYDGFSIRPVLNRQNK